MNAINRPADERAIEPWPVGWPLPLAAIAPSLRWQDVVKFYLAYCEAISPERGTTAPARSSTAQQAA
jgi:hypothetical protein